MSRLSPTLAAFLANPFDPDAIRCWYLALTNECPLWALQQHAYDDFSIRTVAPGYDLTGDGDVMVDPLGVNGAWRLMLEASEDRDAVRRVAHSSREYARCLVQAYRALLILETEDPPLAARFSRAGFVAPKGAPPMVIRSSDVERDDTKHWFYDILTSLVVQRDVASKAELHQRQKDLDQFLAAVGVTRKRGRRSLPHMPKFVRLLGQESQAWLAAELACRGIPLSDDAHAEFQRRQCNGDRRELTRHLALPFLAYDELTVVLSSNPDMISTRQASAVRIVQRRLRAFVLPSTVAKYLAGSAFAERMAHDA